MNTSKWNNILKYYVTKCCSFERNEESCFCCNTIERPHEERKRNFKRYARIPTWKVALKQLQYSRSHKKFLSISSIKSGYLQQQKYTQGLMFSSQTLQNLIKMVINKNTLKPHAWCLLSLACEWTTGHTKHGSALRCIMQLFMTWSSRCIYKFLYPNNTYMT